MRYFRTTRAADLSDDLIVLGWSKAQMRSLLDRYRSGAARQVRTFDAMTSKAAETSGRLYRRVRLFPGGHLEIGLLLDPLVLYDLHDLVDRHLCEFLLLS
jgi:hypothetical protein